MSQKKVNFIWQTYSDHLKKMLRELQTDERSQDVTLVCHDHTKLKAHQVVLKSCSSVFASIFDEHQPNPVIFLRGIQHQELELILQFMYHGEVTLYEDGLDEFLNVARILAVSELMNNCQLYQDTREFEKTENSSAIADSSLFCPVSNESELDNLRALEDISNTERNKPNSVKEQNSQITQCPECDKQFSSKSNCNVHYRSVHSGEKFSCNQCEFKSTQQSCLIRHIKSRHEGVSFPCKQCDYKATQQGHLKSHIQSKHEGLTFPCMLCGFSAARKDGLRLHIQSMHEGLKYDCNQCDYKASSKRNLASHSKSKHLDFNKQ